MSKPAFDPTKPFSEISDKPAFDPTKGFETVDHDSPSMLESAAEGAAKAATLGYHNQIRASVIDPIVEKVGNFLTGQDVDMGDYVENRDKYNRMTKELHDANPKSFAAGEIAGTLATMAIPGSAVAKAGTGLGRVTGSVALGGATGFLTNPGDVQGETGLQLKDRLVNGGVGAALGAVGGAASEGISKAGNIASGSISDWFKRLANEKAVRAAGAMKRETSALGEEGVQKLGASLLDEGVITPLGTANDVAERVGGKVSSYLGKLKGTLEKSEDTLRNFDPSRATPEQLKAFSVANLPTNEIKAQAIDSVKKSLAGAPDEAIQPAIAQIEQWFAKRPEVMSINELQELKTGLNNFLKKSDFYKDMPGISKEGLLAVRRSAKEAIEQKANAAASILGEDSGQIKAINQKLGQMLEAQDMAHDAIARAGANRAISLTDTIAGAGGAAAGGAAVGPVGAMMGLGSALANKAIRTYGDGTAAIAANNFSTFLKNSSPTFQKLAQTNPTAFAAMTEHLSQKYNPMTEPVQKNTPVNMPNAENMMNDPRFMQMIKNPKLREMLQKQDLQKGGVNNNFKESVSEEKAKADFLKGN